MARGSEVILSTQAWIREFVAGEGLCPWALGAEAGMAHGFSFLELPKSPRHKSNTACMVPNPGSCAWATFLATWQNTQLIFKGLRTCGQRYVEFRAQAAGLDGKRQRHNCAHHAHCLLP